MLELGFNGLDRGSWIDAQTQLDRVWDPQPKSVSAKALGINLHERALIWTDSRVVFSANMVVLKHHGGLIKHALGWTT